MSEIKIAAIMRAGTYSPNHIGNDAAILNLVADQLRKRGCLVTTYSEEKFASGIVTEDIIINMCRERKSIELLQKLEDEGRLVINSGYGIENCIGERMARILKGSGIPYPDSIIVNTDQLVINKLKEKEIDRCWIKRGDYYNIHKEDVSYVRHADEAQDIVQEYFLRGIKRAVISKHIDGELVKFYGVVGTPFFYCFSHYSPKANDGKIAEGAQFDKAQLKDACEKAADVLDIMVYGGDCKVAADGSFTIIDFNDWPSFAPCRNEAAVQIARRVLRLAKDRR